MAVRSRRSQPTQTEQISKDNNPSQKDARKKSSRKLFRSVLLVALILLVLYTIPLFVLRYSTWVQQAIVFVHHLRTPFFANFSDPSSFGLKSTAQFELFHEDGCGVEVWHILPKSYHEEVIISSQLKLDKEFTKALSDDAPVILYLHGNTGSRALEHRVGLYKYLAEERGYHVIAFDYRGFANSQCYPSERGMMEDGLLVWNWLKEKAPHSKMYIWGHSLGSAAATYLTKELCDSGSLPDGLILDAPFTDISDAASNHPLSIPFWPIMPLFKYYIIDSFHERFESAERLKHISCPMLILHGRNDFIIPFHIGEKFHKMALEYKKEFPEMGDVEFVDCGETNHKTNFLSPNTLKALERFITNT